MFRLSRVPTTTESRNYHNTVRVGAVGLLAAGLLVAAATAPAAAAPGTPTYQVTFGDATTFQNEFIDTNGDHRWTISPDADDFTTDLYERPVVQDFRDYTEQGTGTVKFATDGDYWGNLDITEASAGFDADFLYVAIDLHDTNRYKTNGQVEQVGLVAEYRLRLSTNADGSSGFMFEVQSPEQNRLDLGDGVWNTTRNYVYWDQDGDLAVDGATPDLQQDNGTGYDTQVVVDGDLKPAGAPQFGQENDTPFFSRIQPGGDDNIVEFAIDYEAFGLTAELLETLPYLEFESNRGNSSTENPDKYLLNHRFSRLDAGSPYAEDNLDGSPWGEQGPNDINEIDTLRGGAIPEPASLAMLVLAGAGLLGRRRRHA